MRGARWAPWAPWAWMMWAWMVMVMAVGCSRCPEATPTTPAQMTTQGAEPTETCMVPGSTPPRLPERLRPALLGYLRELQMTMQGGDWTVLAPFADPERGLTLWYTAGAHPNPEIVVHADGSVARRRPLKDGSRDNELETEEWFGTRIATAMYHGLGSDFFRPLRALPKDSEQPAKLYTRGEARPSLLFWLEQMHGDQEEHAYVEAHQTLPVVAELLFGQDNTIRLFVTCRGESLYIVHIVDMDPDI